MKERWIGSRERWRYIELRWKMKNMRESHKPRGRRGNQCVKMHEELTEHLPDVRAIIHYEDEKLLCTECSEIAMFALNAPKYAKDTR
jgi:hypothetical protein